MNAMTESMPRMAAPHRTHTFKLLLKREYWEHRGGFLWAPLIAGGVFLLFTLMAIIAAEVARVKAGDREVQIDGRTVSVNGIDLGMLTQNLKPDELQHLGGAIDLATLMSAGVPFIALGFVIFFYALGTLYDDRKDRSVLFWKSLPVSDSQTVLSKVASAAVVAPIITTLAAIATALGFLVMISLFALIHGGNPWQLIWGPGSPLQVLGSVVASIPVYALWMLPTVGWLMLCSSFARTKPFLWAVLIPVFIGIFVSWFDVMAAFNLESVWFWKNIVARGLLSVFPFSMGDVMDFSALESAGGPANLDRFALASTAWSAAGSANLWIGAVVGAVMIAAAIRLRRWRDEG